MILCIDNIKRVMGFYDPTDNKLRTVHKNIRWNIRFLYLLLLAIAHQIRFRTNLSLLYFHSLIPPVIFFFHSSAGRAGRTIKYFNFLSFQKWWATLIYPPLTVSCIRIWHCFRHNRDLNLPLMDLSLYFLISRWNPNSQQKRLCWYKHAIQQPKIFIQTCKILFNHWTTSILHISIIRSNQESSIHIYPMQQTHSPNVQQNMWYNYSQQSYCALTKLAILLW